MDGAGDRDHVLLIGCGLIGRQGLLLSEFREFLDELGIPLRIGLGLAPLLSDAAS